MGGQVRHENTQAGTHVVAESGCHARGRGQHRVNDEDGGTLLPARPVDVHLHGVASIKTPGAPLRP